MYTMLQATNIYYSTTASQGSWLPLDRMLCKREKRGVFWRQILTVKTISITITLALPNRQKGVEEMQFTRGYNNTYCHIFSLTQHICTLICPSSPLANTENKPSVCTAGPCSTQTFHLQHYKDGEKRLWLHVKCQSECLLFACLQAFHHVLTYIHFRTLFLWQVFYPLLKAFSPSLLRLTSLYSMYIISCAI